MKENDVVERSPLARRLVCGELTPLLELEWRLEEAFNYIRYVVLELTVIRIRALSTTVTRSTFQP